MATSQIGMSFLSQPWHWSVSGIAIAAILFIMTWMGRSFGVSTTFKGICTLAGAGKRIPFFDIDIKEEYWRIAFVLGGVLGGFITANFLQSPEPVAISEATIGYLGTIGIDYPEADSRGMGFVPTEVFNFTSLKGIILALAGGFLVGFGARYGD
ncbi:MAG: YeeE/YedE family protein, partial [Bacteroidetes bacterium]|nr:YeeE/YedE family protein [Bacteroidota bacterium]